MELALSYDDSGDYLALFTRREVFDEAPEEYPKSIDYLGLLS